VGIDLYQIEVAFLSDGQGLGDRQYAQVLAPVSDYPNLSCPDPLVYTKVAKYTSVPAKKNSLSANSRLNYTTRVNAFQSSARRRRALPCSTLCPRETYTSCTLPERSALSSLLIFMASMTIRTSPA